MKKCRVCSTECASELIRCPVCHALLPAQEISTNFFDLEADLKKICSCGCENNKSAVRCKECGHFLSDVPVQKVYRASAKADARNISIEISTGEMLPFENDLVIGRAYQEGLWDDYAHRAAYRLHFVSGCLMLDDLITKTTRPVVSTEKIKMGRKSFIIHIEKPE